MVYNWLTDQAAINRGIDWFEDDRFNKKFLIREGGVS